MTKSRNIVPIVTFLLLLLLCAGPLALAEQITTVAVFDMDKVLLSFYSDSDILRDYRIAADQYRDDLLIAEDDLRDLQARRATAISRNDSRLASRLREDIEDQREYIIALEERWYQTEDEMLAELQDDPFYENLYYVVGYVAEENGYTLVIDVSSSAVGVFWYSQAIDVTEDIIEELLVQFR
jgi:Skp family chaperone for outer membrane proteins